MDTKWLEDFVSLANTHSFTRSAKLRYVTQPAFSRRIQSLENWVGAELVDRTSYPATLTPAGKTMYAQAQEILQNLVKAQSLVHGFTSEDQSIIEFALPHTLALTFFPTWMSSIQSGFGALKSRLMAFNVNDAVKQLIDGACDILITYAHPAHPLPLDPSQYEMVILGEETVMPYSLAQQDGSPLFCLPGTLANPIPYLAYMQGAYLGGIADMLINLSTSPLHVSQVYETDMSESLKAMVLEGHGIAFLPSSSVSREVESGRLALTLPEYLQNDLCCTLQIRAYRNKLFYQNESIGAKKKALHQISLEHKLAVEQLWTYLMTQANAKRKRVR